MKKFDVETWVVLGSLIIWVIISFLLFACIQFDWEKMADILLIPWGFIWMTPFVFMVRSKK